MDINKFPPEKRQFYIAKLQSTFNSKKLFLNTSLDMPHLAAETKIKLHIISYIVNSEYSLHFKDYINIMRIEYFKERINDYQWKDLTLEEMTEASGFKSRTTCYRAFIKHIGETPAEYLKKNRVSLDTPPVRRVKRYKYG